MPLLTAAKPRSRVSWAWAIISTSRTGTPAHGRPGAVLVRYDDPGTSPAVPPHVAVWRSVRVHCQTKTERSRRALGLPQVAADALRDLLAVRAREQAEAGSTGTTPGWSSKPSTAPPSTWSTSARCSSECARPQEPATPGRHASCEPPSHEPPRSQHRRDRPARRPHLHPDHRSRLPPRAPPRDHHRRRDHGRDLQSQLTVPRRYWPPRRQATGGTRHGGRCDLLVGGKP